MLKNASIFYSFGIDTDKNKNASSSLHWNREIEP